MVVDLSTIEIDRTAAQILGHEYAAQFNALPIKRDASILYVATHNPACMKTLNDIADITACHIVPLHAREEDIRFYISNTFGAAAIHTIASQFVVEKNLQDRSETDPALLEALNAAPAVRLIDSLIDTGVLNRASDLHIEPFGRQLRARYRVDGILHTHGLVDISLLANIISRLKIMGNMDIAEKRLPQDGHFTLSHAGEAIDFRLSTMPTMHGEKAVIRLLYGGASARMRKNDLGFKADDLVHITRLFHQPYGAVIITGPTGSGKSTTLSTFLEELNQAGRNIMTVEDPVENPLLGVNHINAQTGGLGFAGALKHILRQDPDVIMIGEMRDRETARIAVQAALTGHVVLSTLHTNDAAGVIERLTDMGVEHYLAAAALNGIISQRLVRRTCPHCVAPATLTREQAALLEIPAKAPVFAGVGCGRCRSTGYHSRFAVYEYVILNEHYRRQMAEAPVVFARDLRALRGLRKNALHALTQGRTTAEEVIKALHRDG